MGVFKQIIAWIGSLRRKRTILTVAILSVVSATLFAASRDGEAQSGGAARNMPNPLDIFAARSPGGRPEGVLLQKKKRMASLARSRPPGAPPRERVLSVGRVRPTGAPLFPGVETPFALADVPLSFVSVPGPGVGQGPAFEVPTIIIGDVPSSSSSGPETPVPPNPGPAVPEPATWMLMILGIGWVGFTLRRRELAAANTSTDTGTGKSPSTGSGADASPAVELRAYQA